MKKQLCVFNYSIKNQGEESADIYIDGYIVDADTQEFLKEWWGDTTSVSYKSLRDQITASTAKVFNVYINSGGGHVGDAMAIHDLFVDLQSKGITIKTKVRGICCSSATYIAMSSPNSTITENSWFMIHNASGAIWGNVDEVENYAKTLRKFNDLIVNFYSKRTGLSTEEVSNLMNNETWMNAQEATDKKFINKKTDSVEFTNSIKPEQWQFSNKEVFAAYNSSTQKTPDMDMKKIETAIENGFQSVINKLFPGNKTDDKASKEAITEFTTNVCNAIKETVPTNEAITKLVEDKLKEMTEGDAQVIENAVKEGTKNFATKEDLKNEIKTLSGELAQNLGGESSPKDEKKNVNPKNRFAGREWFKG